MSEFTEQQLTAQLQQVVDDHFALVQLHIRAILCDDAQMMLDNFNLANAIFQANGTSPLMMSDIARLGILDAQSNEEVENIVIEHIQYCNDRGADKV